MISQRPLNEIELSQINPTDMELDAGEIVYQDPFTRQWVTLGVK